MSEPTTTTPAQQHQFPCKQCGANLQFQPGTTSLVCPYCGAVNAIAPAPKSVEELDINQYFQDCCREENLTERVTVRCNTCGAETTLAPDITAGRCPFCGSGIVAQASSKKLIKPNALLPFAVTQQKAADEFRNWIAGLWFAPTELSHRAEAAQIAGVYIPAWTYDANTQTNYTGQRGTDYWVTETYTEYVNGQPQTRTRQVQHTSWSPASGSVDNTFDDLLVLASRSLPTKLADALEPWDLKDCIVYQDEYLSGFVAESYQIGLPEGFETAKNLMAPDIEQSIRQDIGGDHQRIASVDTQYSDVTFKHALLPVWISAYRYAGETYRFLINARTGEVQGERPYSWIKITFAILSALLAIAIIALLATGSR